MKNLPGYELKLWNEKNTVFDNAFLAYTLKRKEWAFISDYIRMRALHEYGGVYLDADIEIIRSLDPLLKHSCFLGYEAEGRINSAAIGSTQGHPFPKRCMDLIESRHRQRLPYLIAPEVAMAAFKLSSPEERVFVCPPDYFYPYNPYDPSRPLNNFMYSDITENTYGVHHWGKCWKQSFLKRAIKKLIP